MRKLAVTVITLLILLGATFVAKDLVLDHASYVSLSESQVTLAVSKALVSNASPNYLPIAGKDYSIASIQYFENKNWAVVGIKPIGTQSDPGTLILEKTNDVYKSVLGPDNSFQNANFSGIPEQVVNYVTGGK